MPRRSAGHQQSDRSTVVDAAGIGRGYRALAVEGRAQLLHVFDGGAVANILVLLDDHLLAPLRDGDRRDFVGEPTGLLRRLGFVLAGQGEGVLFVAAELPLLGDILGCCAHVVAVEGIPQAVFDHAVDQFQVAHLLTGAHMRHVGAERHAFLTAGDDDSGVAELDVLGASGDRAQARAADLVDTPGRALNRQAGIDMRLAGRVLALTGS